MSGFLALVCPHCGSDEQPRRSPSLRLCCDSCWDGLPRDLPGEPAFRSQMRWAYSGSGHEMYSEIWHQRRARRPALWAAVTEYLAASRPAPTEGDA